MNESTFAERNKTFTERVLRDLDSNANEDRAYLVQKYADAAHSLAQAADLLIKAGEVYGRDTCASAAAICANQIKSLLSPTP